VASLRKVRKELRKAMLIAIKQGKRSTRDLFALADAHFGSNDCGYHAVIKAFVMSEVNNAVSFLRQEGHIETVGKEWKPVEEIDQDDALKIMARRKKQIRGLAKGATRFAHEHGHTEDAVCLLNVLGIVKAEDDSEVTEGHAVEVPAHVLK
jgi:hypothetical protein